MKVNKAIARKVVELVNHGLVRGVGVQEPGKMCVEAAVCCALGLRHGDNPPCVSQAVRSFKIALNDSDWSSNEARAKGLKRLAVAQLGSDGIDETLFVKELALSTIRQVLPIALMAAGLKVDAKACKESKDLYSAKSAAAAAAAAAWAAWAAAWASEAAWATKSAAWASAAAAWASEAAAWAAWAAEAATKSASEAAEAAEAASEAAEAASEAAAANMEDKVLSLSAECAVEALIKCKSPGCQWLDLCD